MRCTLAVTALAACFVFALVPACIAGQSREPGLAAQATSLPEPPASIPEPPAGTQAPSNIDTPPAFTRRPASVRRSTRPDLTFAVKPAPAEFRGLAWGSDLAGLTGLLPVTKPVALPGTYFRPDETLRLGEAEIRSVAYYFPKGKLTGVGIIFEGQDNFFLLKDHLIELYGPGRQMGDRYGWTWSNFFIDLRMRDSQGELRYATQP